MTIIDMSPKNEDHNVDLLNRMMDNVTEIRKTRGVTQKGGKKYTMIQDRVETMRRAAGDYYRVSTELMKWEGCEGGMVVVKATITDPSGAVVATGHAEEVRGSNYINETSALENAETSAVGRALAVLGIHGGEFASADEIGIAIAKREKISGLQTRAAGAGADKKDEPVQPEAVALPALGEQLEAEVKPVEKRATRKSAPKQTDIVEAVKDAGGKTNTELKDHPILSGLDEVIIGTVTSVQNRTPVLSRELQDCYLIGNVFMTFIPLCETVEDCYSFWTKNEPLIHYLKAEEPTIYQTVFEAFTKRKSTIQKEAKK